MGAEASAGDQEALVAFPDSGNTHRVVVQVVECGAMVFAFDSSDSVHPERDYFLPDLASAKAFAADEWGTPEDSWTPSIERPDG
jgi:hypothetical protein